MDMFHKNVRQDHSDLPNGYLETIEKGIAGVRAFRPGLSRGVGTRQENLERLKREIETADAIVIGADILNKFVVSGFQSFKALSTDRCKPFDQNRCGLNLGEGAATIVLEQSDIVPHGAMQIVGTGNRNDANHISGPSRTGEGLFNAISDAISSRPSIREEISFINAHGTATPYNDDMESWAIDRSGMRHIPVNSLKGCFGHTLGAAGILECIISCMALEKNIILPTYGHDTKGVAKEITVNKQLCTGRGDAFLKIISGIGGSNAAIIYRRQQ